MMTTPTDSMDLMDSKPWYLSRGVWGGIVAAVAGVLALLGRSLPADAVGPLTDDVMRIVEGLAAVIGGALAIYGRVKAQTPVGK